ncbi:MAG: tyrosine-type recombinase/integrase [Desulfovibrionaceae bacterium]
MAIRKINRKKPYQVYWRNPYTGKLQTAHFSTLAEARKHDSLVKHRLAHEPKYFAPSEEQTPASDLTVESIIWSYLNDRKLKPASLRDTIYHLKAVLPHVGHVSVVDLSKSHMRGLVDDLRGHGLKPNGINRKISIIKAALNWAEEREIITANPIRTFSCPRGQDEQIPPPTPEELRAMLAVAQPHIQRVIILGLSMGMRVGESEMFGMVWDDVDISRWKLRVWAAEKNMRAQWRELDIKPSLRPLINEWRNADAALGMDRIIHWRGNPVTTIKRAWKATLRRAGIRRRIRPYDLRHAHATEALAAGADAKAVAENMGHADTTMILKHYQHVMNRQRQAAIEAVPDLLIQGVHTNEEFSTVFCMNMKTKLQ